MSNSTIRIVESIAEPADYEDGKRAAHVYIEFLEDVDREIHRLFKGLIETEDQKGKIVEEAIEAASKFERTNITLLQDVEDGIDDMFYELTRTVNDMNMFDMSVTYEVEKSTSATK